MKIGDLVYFGINGKEPKIERGSEMDAKKIQGKEDKDYLLILMIHCGIQRQVLFQLQSQLFLSNYVEKGILTGIVFLDEGFWC